MILHVHVQKAAGTTINRILMGRYGRAHCQVLPVNPVAHWIREADYGFARKTHRPLRSAASHRISPAADAVPGALYVTALRDPLRRTASHLQFRAEQLGDDTAFEEWIARPEMRNLMVRRFSGRAEGELSTADLDAAKEALAACAFVGVVEGGGLPGSIDGFARLFGLGAAPRANTSRGSGLAKRLLADDGARRTIEAANGLDQDLYAYARELAARPQRLAAELHRVPAPPLSGGVRGHRAWRKLVYTPAIGLARRRWAERHGVTETLQQIARAGGAEQARLADQLRALDAGGRA